MIQKGNVLYIEGRDTAADVLEKFNNSLQKPVLAARGRACRQMLELAEYPALFAAAVALEPWIDPVCEYGRNPIPTVKNETLSSVLEMLFEEAYFPSPGKTLCPLLILKEYDGKTFGTIQAEALFNRIKSCSPHTKVTLLLYKDEKEQEARHQAVQYLQEMAGVCIER